MALSVAVDRSVPRDGQTHLNSDPPMVVPPHPNLDSPPLRYRRRSDVSGPEIRINLMLSERHLSLGFGFGERGGRSGVE